MKAGTAMDPFPESYEGDPMANVRTEEPPKDPEGEEEEEEAEQSEDLNVEPEPDEDVTVDQEASSSR